MKVRLLLAVAVAALASAVTLETAEAGHRFSRGHFGPGFGPHPGHGWGHAAPLPRRGWRGGHCGPVHRIRTVEVARRTHFRTSYLRCGRPFNQPVTVVTYVDYFSNGTSRTWTQTFH